MINDNGSGVPIRSDLAGESLDSNVVLVMYTITGDLDLNETVNADDYAQIDSGFAAHLSGYRWGDLNYSGGPPNADDYFLMDQAFAQQSAGVSPEAASASSAVVETKRAKHKPRRAMSNSRSVAVDAVPASWDRFREMDMPVSSRFWVVTKPRLRRLASHGVWEFVAPQDL